MIQTLLHRRGPRVLALLVLSVATVSAGTTEAIIDEVLPKIVKIYGAGGIRGLEPYQSGFLISADGYILTAYSYVLDTDDGEVTVTLDDGREFAGSLVGYDPRPELAVLKIDASELPHFDPARSVDLQPGDRVLAFSNLYGIATGNEPASVLHGTVSAVTRLSGRRGAFDTPYDGPIYVVDAIINNAGAAGGVVTDRQGRLAAVIGKEIRSKQIGIWLNYALPVSSLAESLQDMLAGKSRPREEAARPLAKQPWSLAGMGMLLIPDILPHTPPFVEAVVAGSPAGRAGLLPDDLIVFVNKTMVRSEREFMKELLQYEQVDDLSLVVMRDKSLVPLTVVPIE